MLWSTQKNHLNETMSKKKHVCIDSIDRLENDYNFTLKKSIVGPIIYKTLMEAY